MIDEKILAQFDRAALAGLWFLAAAFVVLSCILSLVIAIAATSFVVCYLIARKALILVLKRRETAAVFAVLGV